MKRTTYAMQLALLLSMGLSSKALACGTCVYSMVEPGLPMVVPWSIIAACAFCLVPIFARPPKGAFLSGLFSPIGTGIVFVLLSLLAVQFGPLPFAFTLLLAGIGILQAVVSTRSRGSIIFAAVVISALAVTGVYSTLQARHRDAVDRVLRWPSSPTARGIMSSFKTAGDLASLRRVLQGDGEEETVRAAEFLAEHGELEVDGPLMIAAIRRFEKESSASAGYNREGVTRALGTLLGKRLPDNSTTDLWQRAYDFHVALARGELRRASQVPSE